MSAILSRPQCVNNISFGCPIILEFYIDHSIYTALVCAKFQNEQP